MLIWSFVCVLVITPVILIYLTFSNSVDCSQMVIDTYELHSRIDIPKVHYVNCYYDEQSQTRISVYDLQGAIDMNGFEKIEASSEALLKGMRLLSSEERPGKNELYLASGERWGTKWTYALDRETNRLWAELNY